MQIGLIRQVKELFFKELKCEWRNRYAVNGILVQLLSSVFICYLLFQQLNSSAWISLFLLVMLFSSTNAIARSFSAESDGRMLYYHQLTHPLAIFIAKVMINSLMALVVAALAWFTFKIFLGSHEHSAQLVLLLFVFCIGTGLLLSAISAISAKSKGGNLLMPVLSFPLMIPMLLICTSALKKDSSAMVDSILPDILVLSFTVLMIGVLTSLLYKFIWQE